MGSQEDSKQVIDMRKRQVSHIMEGIHSRIQYLGRKGEFGECHGGN